LLFNVILLTNGNGNKLGISYETKVLIPGKPGISTFVLRNVKPMCLGSADLYIFWIFCRFYVIMSPIKGIKSIDNSIRFYEVNTYG